MKALGHLQDKEEVDFMMKRFDLYQTGDISFEEYCIMMSVPHDFLHSKWAPEPMLTANQMDEDGLGDRPVSQTSDRSEMTSAEADFERRASSRADFERRASLSIDADAQRDRELRAAFMALDIDSSGFIDPHNIKEVMSRLGTSLSVDEAKKMVEIADYKKNGVIEFDEFLELMSSESKATSVKSDAVKDDADDENMSSARKSKPSDIDIDSKEVESLDSFQDLGWREKPDDNTFLSPTAVRMRTRQSPTPLEMHET